jgi:hypothetical protein
MRCLIHLKNEKSKFDGGTLTVDACTVRSSAAEFGGGIINDGRNAGSATLTVTNSLARLRTTAGLPLPMSCRPAARPLTWAIQALLRRPTTISAVTLSSACPTVALTLAHSRSSQRQRPLQPQRRGLVRLLRLTRLRLTSRAAARITEKRDVVCGLAGSPQLAHRGECAAWIRCSIYCLTIGASKNSSRNSGDNLKNLR